MVEFTHLHCHSEFSLLDGLSTPEEIVETAKNHGQKAIAISDHGTMAGTYRFSKAASEMGVNGIIGVEAYYVPDLAGDSLDKKTERFHLILLAKNDDGLSQLQKVMRRAWTEGFYVKPRIEFADLESLAGNVVCLSGCMASHLSRLLLAGEEGQAEGLARRFRKLFQDDYYIEIQPWDHGEHLELSGKLSALASSLHIPMVGSIDCHYPTKEDAGIEEVLLAVGQYPSLNAGQTRNIKECSEQAQSIEDLTDKINMLMPDRRLRFDQISPYIMSNLEVEQAFSWVGFGQDVLDNSCIIADKCKTGITKNANLLPKYTKLSDSSMMLEEIAKEGLGDRIKDTAYRERLENEIAVIKKLDFSDYFLIIWDLVNWAKKNGIRVGPGRGSVGGSLLAYAMGITQVDPIEHKLLFARFISSGEVRYDPVFEELTVNEKPDII